MFDFRTTLKEGDHALNNGNIALAMFNYWLVNFAFGDEEYPYFYKKKIYEMKLPKIRNIYND